jgi:hypothetical protein
MAAARFTDPIEPMDLANMRQNGVRSLAVSCHLCHHEAIISAAPWPDAVPVPTFGPRMVCTRCGIIGADARPHWQEQPAREKWRKNHERAVRRRAEPGAQAARRLAARLRFGEE